MKIIGRFLCSAGLLWLVLVGLHVAGTCLAAMSLCPMWLGTFADLGIPRATCGWNAAWPLLLGWCCFVVGVALIAWANHKAKARGSEV